MRNALRTLVWTSVVLTAFSTLALAQDILPSKEDIEAPKKESSPFVGDHFPTRVLWGDSHLHTSWSGDAGLTGATLGPDTAYRVTRGETVTSYEGWKVKLHRPLDWVVVADHAENLGIADFIRRSDPICLANETCKRWHDMNKAGKGYEAFFEFVRDITTDQINEPRRRQRVAGAADSHLPLQVGLSQLERAAVGHRLGKRQQLFDSARRGYRQGVVGENALEHQRRTVLHDQQPGPAGRMGRQVPVDGDLSQIPLVAGSPGKLTQPIGRRHNSCH